MRARQYQKRNEKKENLRVKSILLKNTKCIHRTCEANIENMGNRKFNTKSEVKQTFFFYIYTI